MVVALAALRDEHHGGVGLVEVREVMEGGDLVERPEIGNGRSAAEGDDDAVADAGGEGVAARAVLRCGYLRVHANR